MLSSINKLANYTGLSVDPSKPGNDALKNRQRLLNWQASVSRLIETYCNRFFLIDTYTEKFDTHSLERVFFPQALPIASITSVKADSLGRFDGTSDYTLSDSDYRLGVDSMSLVLNYPVLPAHGGLQVTLVGGLAYHATRSTYVVSASGTPEAGKYCMNATGEAAGIVVSYLAGTLVVENLYGRFEVDESLVFSTTEEGLYKSDSRLAATATITSVTRRSIAEAYPDLERACEIETRYMSKHQLDFENVSTMNDQTSRRQQTVWQSAYVFQPETLAILGRYRRIIL